MSERAELIEQLLDNWEMWGSPSRDGCTNESCMAVDCKEAADLLEADAARIAELEQRLRALGETP